VRWQRGNDALLCKMNERRRPWCRLGREKEGRGERRGEVRAVFSLPPSPQCLPSRRLYKISCRTECQISTMDRDKRNIERSFCTF